MPPDELARYANALEHMLRHLRAEQRRDAREGLSAMELTEEQADEVIDYALRRGLLRERDGRILIPSPVRNRTSRA